MADLDLNLDADRAYPIPPMLEQEARDRGWTPAYSVSGTFPIPQSDPDYEIRRKLVGRDPFRTRREDNLPDLDAALAQAETYERDGASHVAVVEVSAYDREQIAAERAFESRFG